MPKVNLSYGSETDQLFRDMNVLMQQYDRAGVRMPNEIRKHREKIANIYQQYNIKGQFAKNDIFPRGAAIDKLNPGIRDELYSIAEGMMDSKYVYNLKDYENYLDILRDNKFEKWNVTTVNDVIERLDYLKNSVDDEVIKNILSSDQLLDLYDVAHVNGISDDELFEIISDKYNDSEKTGDTLHKLIYKSIQDMSIEEEAEKPVKFGDNTGSFSKEMADHVNDIRLPRGPEMSGNRKGPKKR